MVRLLNLRENEVVRLVLNAFERWNPEYLVRVGCRRPDQLDPLTQVSDKLIPSGSGSNHRNAFPGRVVARVEPVGADSAVWKVFDVDPHARVGHHHVCVLLGGVEHVIASRGAGK
ncbi:hypothetical protein D3C80_1576270 [compost metagenome]